MERQWKQSVTLTLVTEGSREGHMGRPVSHSLIVKSTSSDAYPLVHATPCIVNCNVYCSLESKRHKYNSKKHRWCSSEHHLIKRSLQRHLGRLFSPNSATKYSLGGSFFLFWLISGVLVWYLIWVYPYIHCFEHNSTCTNGNRIFSLAVRGRIIHHSCITYYQYERLRYKQV